MSDAAMTEVWAVDEGPSAGVVNEEFLFSTIKLALDTRLVRDYHTLSQEKALLDWSRLESIPCIQSPLSAALGHSWIVCSRWCWYLPSRVARSTVRANYVWC